MGTDALGTDANESIAVVSAILSFPYLYSGKKPESHSNT